MGIDLAEPITFSGQKRPTSEAVNDLVQRGDLVPLGNGQIGLAGSVLKLYRHFECLFERLAAKYGAQRRDYPTLIPVPVLAKTDYFSSFPQHATFAVNLAQNPEAIGRFVSGIKNGDQASASAMPHLASPQALLSSAVCYHVYAEFENRKISHPYPIVITAQGHCFRFEDGRFSPLKRQWEFTMREIVFVGREADIEQIRFSALEEVLEIAKRYGFSGRVEPAADPFYGVVEGRARTLLQRAKALKYELKIDVSDNSADLAIASFNLHEDYFGKTFNISLPDESPCWTCCVAFGLERWISAFVAYHGSDPEEWEAILSSTKVD